MTKRITESQLRKIIAEAAQKILNEENRSPLTDNPGGVENDRVRAKGFTAQFHVPGKRWGDSHEHYNDSTYDVIKKHNGGLNAKKTLTQLLVHAVDFEDEMAAKEFFRVLSKVKPLYRAVLGATMRYAAGLEKD